MTASLWLALARIAMLVALSASAALYVHYLDPADSGFCGIESGCEAVRRSPLSYFKSTFLNVPLVGLIAYGTLLMLSVGHARLRTLCRQLGTLGGALAVGLLGYQMIGLGTLCWLCAVVDGSAIAAGGFMWLAQSGEQRELLRPAGWLAVAGLAVAGPLAFSALKPPAAVPPGIAALYVPGKVNVIEFADFQCPHCRKLHPILGRLVKDFGERVHMVRLNMPLAGHPLARGAARAAICAGHQGREPAMADALFTGELTPTAIVEAARLVGLDLPAFQHCLEAPETEQQIEREVALLEASGFVGLPTTFIGPTRIIGVKSEVAFRDALERAASGDSGGGVPVWAFIAAWLALVLGVLGATRNT